MTHPPVQREPCHGTERRRRQRSRSILLASARRAARPERAIQREIVRWLRERGCLVAVTDAAAAYKAGGFFGCGIPPGWPDLTGLLPGGRFIGVECKAPGRTQSPRQKAIEREIRSRGGLYVLARGIADLRRVLEQTDDDDHA